MVDSHSQRPCWVRGITGFFILDPAGGKGPTCYYSSAGKTSTSLFPIIFFFQAFFQCLRILYPCLYKISAEILITLAVFTGILQGGRHPAALGEILAKLKSVTKNSQEHS
jgi:hypothetical protein